MLSTLMQDSEKPYIDFKIIESLALKEGAVAVGAVKAGGDDEAGERLDRWLAMGREAEMAYMGRNTDKRKDVRLLVPGAQSVVVMMFSYNDARVDKESVVKIAHYAQRRDYHFALKQKMNRIVADLKKDYPDFEARVFTDSAPIMERYWARKAGLGWIGRSSMLINKDWGSKVFLCEIVCNFITDYNKENVKPSCGECRRCIEACPNKAIDERLGLDSSRCISYQTIEKKSAADREIELGGYIYGCDICVEVCPWNRKARTTEQQDTETKQEVLDLLQQIEHGTLNRSDFKRLAKISPLNRIRYDKFLDNIDLCKSQLDSKKEK